MDSLFSAGCLWTSMRSRAKRRTLASSTLPICSAPQRTFSDRRDASYRSTWNTRAGVSQDGSLGSQAPATRMDSWADAGLGHGRWSLVERPALVPVLVGGRTGRPRVWRRVWCRAAAPTDRPRKHGARYRVARHRVIGAVRQPLVSRPELGERIDCPSPRLRLQARAPAEAELAAIRHPSPGRDADLGPNTRTRPCPRPCPTPIPRPSQSPKREPDGDRPDAGSRPDRFTPSARDGGGHRPADRCHSPAGDRVEHRS